MTDFGGDILLFKQKIYSIVHDTGFELIIRQILKQ